MFECLVQGSFLNSQSCESQQVCAMDGVSSGKRLVDTSESDHLSSLCRRDLPRVGIPCALTECLCAIKRLLPFHNLLVVTSCHVVQSELMHPRPLRQVTQMLCAGMWWMRLQPTSIYSSRSSSCSILLTGPAATDVCWRESLHLTYKVDHNDQGLWTETAPNSVV